MSNSDPTADCETTEKVNFSDDNEADEQQEDWEEDEVQSWQEQADEKRHLLYEIRPGAAPLYSPYAHLTAQPAQTYSNVFGPPLNPAQIHDLFVAADPSAADAAFHAETHATSATNTSNTLNGATVQPEEVVGGSTKMFEIGVRTVVTRVYDWCMQLEPLRTQTGELLSPEIAVGGRKFKASIGFANGTVSLWVGLVDTLGPTETAEYVITLVARDPANNVSAVSEEAWTGAHAPPKWKGVQRACSHEQLVSKQRFPENLCIRVRLTVRVAEQVQREPRYQDLGMPLLDCPLPLGADIQSLVLQKHHSDIQLLVREPSRPKIQRLYAHKCILSARSPVFRAMFSLPMTEKSASVLPIKDIRAQTMRLLLYFIYTDRLPPFVFELSSSTSFAPTSRSSSSGSGTGGLRSTTPTKLASSSSPTPETGKCDTKDQKKHSSSRAVPTNAVALGTKRRSAVTCADCLDLVGAADRFGMGRLAELAFNLAAKKLRPPDVRAALQTALLHAHYHGSEQLINAIGFVCLSNSHAVSKTGFGLE